MRVVPSIGSTATSHSGPSPLPTSSPLYSMGASSFSPSPITTTPCIDTELTMCRIASTAAPSPPSLSPRPTHRPAAIAAASVTRTSSSARLRSGASRRGVLAVMGYCLLETFRSTRVAPAEGADAEGVRTIGVCRVAIVSSRPMLWAVGPARPEHARFVAVRLDAWHPRNLASCKTVAIWRGR